MQYHANHMTQKFQAYTNAAMTVGKTRQVVMLYDGAIRFVQQAAEAIRRGDFETRYNLLAKANAVISGLQNSLDHEKGGEIAKLLHDYYASIDARLFSVHRTNDTAVLEGVLKELRMMRDAWQEIDQKHSGKQVHDGASAPLPTGHEVAGCTGIGVSA